MTDTCLKRTDLFTYVRRTPPFFHGKRKRKGYITKRTFIFLKKLLIFDTLNFFFNHHNYVMQCFFKSFSRCFFPNKSYFNWYLQSYTNPSVYCCSCNFVTRIRSGQGKELVSRLAQEKKHMSNNFFSLKMINSN